jgi:hypothetical protein
VKPRLAENRIAKGRHVKLAQTLSHVFCVENQIVPEAESNGKERISESSQGMAGNGGRPVKLVEQFLFDFVRIFSDLSKIVDKSCNENSMRNLVNK